MKIRTKKEKIRELRLSKGWTQENLAELSNVHTRTIQRIESEGLASIQSLNALAKAQAVEPKLLKSKESVALAEEVDIEANIDKQSHIRLPLASLHERSEIKKLAREAERLDALQTYGWAGWVLLFIGAYLTVDVLLMTEANLNRTVLFNVFFPGIAIGQILMLIGAFGIHLGKKAAREKRILIRSESPLFQNSNLSLRSF